MHKLAAMRWRKALWFLVAIVPMARAWAVLGQVPGPGAQKTTCATVISPSSNCSAWTTVLPSGTVVREFMNAAGQVFAVGWEGPVLPDLAALLGDYAGEYQGAIERQRALGQRGGVLQVHKPILVMVSRGRMGQFSGQAYLPAQVPTGIDMQTLLP